MKRTPPHMTTSRPIRAKQMLYSWWGTLRILSEQLKKFMSPYFIKGTHSCYRANVVGDGDQSCSGEVLFTGSLSLLLAHHVSKAVLGGKKIPLIN